MVAQVAGVASNTGTGVVSVSIPAGTVNGDLLIAVNASDWGTLTQSDLPSGFTQLNTSTYNGGANAVHIVVGYRVASSEPASYNFSNDGSSDNVAAILRITGAAAGPVIVQGTPTANSAQAASIVPTGADDLLITYHGGEQNGGTTNTWLPPTGMTEWVDAQSNTWTSLCVASLQPCPNPSGARLADFSMASLDNGASCAIAIASSSGGSVNTIHVGSDTPSAIHVGSIAVDAMYVGETQVYP